MVEGNLAARFPGMKPQQTQTFKQTHTRRWQLGVREQGPNEKDVWGMKNDFKERRRRRTNLYLEEETEVSSQKMGTGFRVDFTTFSPQPNE